jgi:hypothetical protein
VDTPKQYRVNVVEKYKGDGTEGDRIIGKEILGPFDTLAEAEKARTDRYAAPRRGSIDIWIEVSYTGWSVIVDRMRP